MSVVPNNILKSADSLELVTFGVDMDIANATNTIDIYTRYRAFWKSCVIRNTHLTDKVQYRTDANQTLKDVKPNSELPLKGWGSFLQIISPSGTPDGLVDFECVTLENARVPNA